MQLWLRRSGRARSFGGARGQKRCLPLRRAEMIEQVADGAQAGQRVVPDVDARQADYVTEGLLRTDPADAVIAGTPLLEARVTVAATRLVREITRRRLAATGWVTVRGAAAVHDGHAVVVIGPAGLTGPAGLRLARQPGWQLLAIGRLLAQIEPDGRIMLVP